MPESEEDELLDELHRGWVEVYKKSATTLVLLRIVAEEPADTATIGAELARRTGWELTERGLYRTLRRLAGLGVLTVHETPGRRTGAQRNVYEVSGRGVALLERLESTLIA